MRGGEQLLWTREPSGVSVREAHVMGSDDATRWRPDRGSPPSVRFPAQVASARRSAMLPLRSRWLPRDYGSTTTLVASPERARRNASATSASGNRCEISAAASTAPDASSARASRVSKGPAE